MGLMLGIDTGGTFTDAVLIDERREVLAAAKQLTTRHDLTIGIAKAIDSLPPESLPDVVLVSLSTTLTTNSVVEGKGSPVCALLIGYDERQVQSSSIDCKSRAETGEALHGITPARRWPIKKISVYGKMPASTRWLFSLSTPHSLACGVFPFYFCCRDLQENNVPRDAAKRLKQAFSDAQDEAQRKAAVLALLRHSLRLGHRRLSLKRLEDAVGCGAALENEDLHRCAELVLRASDTHMHARLASLSRQLTSVSNSSSF